MMRIPADHAFFNGLAEDDVRALRDLSTPVTFRPGARIFSAGAGAKTFYLITKGRVILTLPTPGNDQIVQTLGSGEVLGFSWIVPGTPWRFTATALEEVEALGLETEAVRRLASERPGLREALVDHMYEVVVRRLEATRMRLLDMYANPEAR